MIKINECLSKRHLVRAPWSKPVIRMELADEEINEKSPKERFRPYQFQKAPRQYIHQRSAIDGIHN